MFDSLLTENKSSFDTLFGSNDLAHLAIELYDDLESLNAKHILDEIGGYYNNNNQTIHLVAEDTHWKQVLLHEYTHYRVHQLAKENGLASVERLPLWFEEGLSEVMGHGINAFYHGDINQVTISDFHLLDFPEDFHQTRSEGLDPYRQGYFAVQALINDYGTETIQGLLLSQTMDMFYEKLEETTKKSIVEFQQSLLGDLVVNQN